MIAKFVSYVVGAFAAMCIACALIDDDLLHAEVFGRDLLWHTAVLGTLLAASRGMIGDANKVFEPNRLMAEVVSHTHYLPRRWRDAAHKAEVQAEFEEMFPFKAATFAKEMLSIFVAPFVLWYPLCESAPEIVSFVRNFTVHRQGVGDVCSLSAFDFRRHGNAKYGAGTTARKPARSKQGKMEKSFLSFHAQYPTWEPDEGGREVIASLNGFKCSAAPVVPGCGGSLPGSPRRAAAAARAKPREVSDRVRRAGVREHVSRRRDRREQLPEVAGGVDRDGGGRGRRGRGDGVPGDASAVLRLEPRDGLAPGDAAVSRGFAERARTRRRRRRPRRAPRSKPDAVGRRAEARDGDARGGRRRVASSVGPGPVPGRPLRGVAADAVADDGQRDASRGESRRGGPARGARVVAVAARGRPRAREPVGHGRDRARVGAGGRGVIDRDRLDALRAFFCILSVVPCTNDDAIIVVLTQNDTLCNASTSNVT